MSTSYEILRDLRDGETISVETSPEGRQLVITSTDGRCQSVWKDEHRGTKWDPTELRGTPEPIGRGVGPCGLPPLTSPPKTTDHVCYRICIENVPGMRAKMMHVLPKLGFPAFSVVEGRGYWEGRAENNLTIEVVADENTHNNDAIRRAALKLGQFGHQDSVLVTSTPLQASELVTM